MNILIIGTGYVGLVTGACFAEKGHRVTCLDIDPAKIEKLQSGSIPIFEPGLEELVTRNREAGRLFFTSSYSHSIPFNDISFIAVPTPSKQDGSCDLSYVLKAAEEIAKYMQRPHIIVTKSTVPVGSFAFIKTKIEAVLKSRGISTPFDFVSNPEFLKEGSAISDCMNPDRIILGVENFGIADILKEIYTNFLLDKEKIIVMDIPSAEMTKYAANAMLANRISFMNELANLCEKTGANINKVSVGIGSDSRIGKHFLEAGIGYGGSCFPKDLLALKNLAKQVSCETPLLEAVHFTNKQQRKKFLKKIELYFDKIESLSNKTIGIWGLSFKPNTSDIREAPSLEVISTLLDKGVYLRLYDPAAMQTMKEQLGNHPRIYWAKDEYDAANKTDALVLLTEWRQFKDVDLKKIFDMMLGKAFFDGRNQFNPLEMEELGFDYFCMGIPTKLQTHQKILEDLLINI